MFDPSNVVPTLWSNGAGSTKELVVARDAAGELEWRISVAAIDKAAAFSSYPNIDRVLVALGSMRLVIGNRAHSMIAGEQVQFAGETLARVQVDQPTEALNVMTRRGRCTAKVDLRAIELAAPTGVTACVQLGDVIADVRITSLSNTLRL